MRSRDAAQILEDKQKGEEAAIRWRWEGDITQEHKSAPCGEPGRDWWTCGGQEETLVQAPDRIQELQVCVRNWGWLVVLEAQRAETCPALALTTGSFAVACRLWRTGEAVGFSSADRNGDSVAWRAQ